jgi:hypothetical protein
MLIIDDSLNCNRVHFRPPFVANQWRLHRFLLPITLPYRATQVIDNQGDLPSDFNHDDTIDAADYIVWRKNPGGIYTQDDYYTWRENFGRTLTGSGSSSAFPPPPSALNNTIPEPSTFILAAVCALRLYSMRQTGRSETAQATGQRWPF